MRVTQPRSNFVSSTHSFVDLIGPLVATETIHWISSIFVSVYVFMIEKLRNLVFSNFFYISLWCELLSAKDNEEESTTTITVVDNQMRSKPYYFVQK